MNVIYTRVIGCDVQVVHRRDGQPEHVIVRRTFTPKENAHPGIQANVILIGSPIGHHFALARGERRGHVTRYSLETFMEDGRSFNRRVVADTDEDDVFAGWGDDKTPVLLVPSPISPLSQHGDWLVYTPETPNGEHRPFSQLPSSFRELDRIVRQPVEFGGYLGQSERWRALVPFRRSYNVPSDKLLKLGFAAKDFSITGFLEEKVMTVKSAGRTTLTPRPKELIDWYDAVPVSPQYVWVREWVRRVKPEFELINDDPEDPYLDSRLALIEVTTGRIRVVINGMSLITCPHISRS